MHIGSDSRAFVDQANKYIHQITSKQALKKPWKLINDGDLWEHFYKAVQAKGPNSIKITWVKGHATPQHVDEGITTQADLEGNDESDKTADLGAELHGKELIRIAGKMHNKHNAYTKFMMEITKHIIEGYLIHRELTEIEQQHEEDMRDKDYNKVAYQPLHYADVDDCRLFQMSSNIGYYKAYREKSSCASDMSEFLNDMLIQPSSEHNRGITWLELYILYRARGHCKPILDPKHAGQAKATPAKQLAKFKKEIKFLTKRIMIGEKDLELLKTIQAKQGNLKGVGISGKHATLGFNVAISDEAKDAIATALTRLPRTINKKDLKDFKDNNKKIGLRELTMRGKVVWDSELPLLTTNNRHVEGDISPNEISAIRNAQGRCTAFYECPHCQALESSDCKAFQFEDLDTKHQCIMCGKRKPVKEWKCECNINWHTCRIHRYARAVDTRNSKQSKTPTGQSSPAENPEVKRVKVQGQSSHLGINEADVNRTGATKRKRHNSQDEYSDGDDDAQPEDIIDLKRKRDHEPNVLIDLGPIVHDDFKPNLYGPVLKRRFMGIP